MRWSLRAAGLATAATLLAGCAAPGTGPTPTGSAPGSASASPSPTPTATPPAPGVYEIHGIQSEVFNSPDPKRPVEVSVPAVPGATPLNAAVRDWGQAQRTAFASATGDQLVGGWALELQQWPVVGVRTSASRYVGELSTTVTRTFYTEAGSGDVWAGPDLIAPSFRPDAARAAVAALTAANAAPPAGASDDAVLADLRFDAAGNLVTLVATGGAPRPGAGLVEVTIPAATASAWLSDGGRRVQAAYAQHWAALANAAGGVQPATPVNCATAKCVSLTFDDGPGPYTDLLLDQLTAAGVKASFFEIGKSVHSRGWVTARQARLGMPIGTHTYDHSNLGKITLPEQTSEMQRGVQAIVGAGGGGVGMMRPPYGNMNTDTGKLGMPLVLWNVDSDDWELLNAEKATATAMKEVKPGSIVLMHDIYATSVDAVPRLVAQLRQQGYTVVPVTQLLGAMSPGITYFSQHSSRTNYSSPGMTVVPVPPPAPAPGAPVVPATPGAAAPGSPGVPGPATSTAAPAVAAAPAPAASAPAPAPAATRPVTSAHVAAGTKVTPAAR